MTISIQSSGAALTALENLSSQANIVADAGAPPSPTSGSAADFPLIDLSGAASASSSASGDLTDAASLADAAVGAGTTIQSLLAQLQQSAVNAADPSLGSAARAALSADFANGLSQIQSTVAGAGVNGVNLIDGSLSTPFTAAGAVTLTPTDLSLGGPLIGLGAGASLSDPSAAASLADQLGNAVGAVGQAVGQIAAQGQTINGHLAVVAQAALSLSPGLAGQVNSDLNSDGARLAALQVQQQLQGSTGSIANQSPQTILSLFR